MASTPSASALSAVLRCRGNIFARNKANKKRPPPGSGYSMGVKCVPTGESGVHILGKGHSWELGHPLQECKSFFLGQRVEIGNRVSLAVTLEASRKNAISMRTDYRTAVNDNEQRKVSKISSRTQAILHASLSQVAKLCYQPRFRREPYFSQTRLFPSGTRRCLGINNYEEKEVTMYSKSEGKLLEKIFDSAASKVLCLSITYSPKLDIADEQTEPVVLCWNGWTTLRNGCILLTVVVSEVLRMQFGMENGRLSIPPVFKSAVVETKKTHSVKHQSLPHRHSAQTVKEDEDTADQKVYLGARRRTSGEHQPLGETTKMRKLD